MKTAPPDPRITLGLRVKELRISNNLTQEELAERCRMFRTYLSRIESGQANPTLTALHDLAQGLGVSVQALLQPPQEAALRPRRVQSRQPISRGRVQR